MISFKGHQFTNGKGGDFIVLGLLHYHLKEVTKLHLIDHPCFLVVEHSVDLVTKSGKVVSILETPVLSFSLCHPTPIPPHPPLPEMPVNWTKRPVGCSLAKF